MLINKLVPSTVSFSGIIGISSNRSAMLSGTEIAGLLKGLDKLETLSLYAVDLLDSGAKTQLKAHLWNKFEAKYNSNNELHPQRHAVLFKLCTGLVTMLVKKPNGGVCRCGGDLDCNRCQGTEIKRHSMYDIERYTGVTTATLYKEPVKSWVDEIINEVLIARSTAHNKVQANYGGRG